MYLIRLIIVGETGVGKTSLLIRFNEDNFILDQKTTIGVDYKAKEISIGEDSVKLQVILFSRRREEYFLNYGIRFGILQARKDFAR